MMVSERGNTFSTYKVGPKFFYDLPDVPILQPLTDLTVVVVRSAPNLAGGHQRIGDAHVGGVGVGDGGGGVVVVGGEVWGGGM
jgi:hypothetical protein